MLQAVASESTSGVRARFTAVRSPQHVLTLGFLLLSAIVGLVSGLAPAYSLLVVLGLAFVAVVISNATIGLIFFTVISFMEVLTDSGATSNLMKLVGLLLFGSWVASAATGRSETDSRTLLGTAPGIVISGSGLVAWSLMSAAWAGDPGAAVSDTSRYLLNLLLIPVVFGTLRRREHIMWFAIAFLSGAVISSLYGFAVPTPSSNFQAGQLTGAIGDANAEAAVLVGALALGLALAANPERSARSRWGAGLGILICLAGTINTLSRSGLIALAAVLVAGIIIGGRWRRWAVLTLVFTSLFGVSYYFVLTPSSTKSRVTSSDTSGRSTIWAVGWRMVQANPVLGVGSGNFPTSSIRYLQGPGELTRTDLIVDTPKVAHNIYLEELADMGFPGLLLFLGIVLGSAASAWKAAQIFESRHDPAMELMSRSAILAVVGFMTSDFFASGEFSKQLWLAFALGPALLGLARRDQAAARAHEPDQGLPSALIEPMPF